MAVNPYLDASIIVALFVEEGGSTAVERFLSAGQEPFVVSDFAAAEFSSAISRHVRMGALTGEDGVERLAEFDRWRLESTLPFGVSGSDIAVADALVRRFDLALRTPDALHVAACLRGGFRLATLDQRLARAALALGVDTEVPT